MDARDSYADPFSSQDRSWSGEGKINSSVIGLFIYFTAAGLLAFVCIAGNLLTILAFVCRDNLQKNPSFWYMSSLAVADMLVGLIAIPTTVYDSLIPTQLSDCACDIILSCHLLAVVPTFGHLLMISLDRYFKLVSPLKYIKFMTLTKAKIIIGFLWFSAFLVTGLFLLPHHVYDVNCLVIKLSANNYEGTHIWLFLTCFQYLPFAALMLCNFRVYQIATRFKNAVEKQLTIDHPDQKVQLRYHSGKLIVDKPSHTVSTASKESDNSVIVVTIDDTQVIKTKKLVEWARTAVRQRKIALLISTIVIAAAVCWFGASTAYMMAWYCNDCGVRGTYFEHFHPWILYLNSAVNPIILLFMSEDFRNGYAHVYSRFISIFRPSHQVMSLIRSVPRGDNV